MRLDSVVPWGRSLDEYRAMFALSPDDLRKRILGCGDGPASFNAELTELGGSVVSVDPVYQFSREEIRSRIEEVRPSLLENVRENREAFVWNVIPNVEFLENLRMTAMNRFLADFEKGCDEGRYRSEGIPELVFRVQEFELALVSHFLFLYSENLDEEFHFNGLMELLRVAREVRVFPLLELSGRRSPHLEPVLKRLRSEGVTARIQTVDYEFQKGGDEMLVLTQCPDQEACRELG